jgi:hypothetical protein
VARVGGEAKGEERRITKESDWRQKEGETIPRCDFTSQLCVAGVTTLCFGTRRSVR